MSNEIIRNLVGLALIIAGAVGLTVVFPFLIWGWPIAVGMIIVRW